MKIVLLSIIALQLQSLKAWNLLAENEALSPGARLIFEQSKSHRGREGFLLMASSTARNSF